MAELEELLEDAMLMSDYNFCIPADWPTSKHNNRPSSMR
jgi:hypothetical protein